MIYSVVDAQKIAGANLHEVPHPVELPELRGSGAEDERHADKGQREPDPLERRQPVVGDDEVGPQSHKKRMGVQKNDGPGRMGERRAPVQKKEVHPEQKADNDSVLDIRPGKKQPLAFDKGVNADQPRRNDRTARRGQKRRDPLVAHLDADDVPAPQGANPDQKPDAHKGDC